MSVRSLKPGLLPGTLYRTKKFRAPGVASEPEVPWPGEKTVQVGGFMQVELMPVGNWVFPFAGDIRILGTFSRVPASSPWNLIRSVRLRLTSP